MCPARAGLDGIIPTENNLDYIMLKFGITDQRAMYFVSFAVAGCLPD